VPGVWVTGEVAGIAWVGCASAQEPRIWARGSWGSTALQSVQWGFEFGGCGAIERGAVGASTSASQSVCGSDDFGGMVTQAEP